MSRKFKAPTSEVKDNGEEGILPIDYPVAVYYRQSTDAQVGNVSTAIQTIDLAADMERRGWKRENIILIDTDAGVSGTTKIDEREGMSQLFELITEKRIRAVACQDEDRLFRDLTQIQVNIFIEACRQAKVLVITPYITYDFAHPLHGDYYARQFRFKCEMAADYIKTYIQGKFVSAKRRMTHEGKWVGAKIPVGYMVDMQKHLPDGSENHHWRKFVPFEPYAQIVLEYYRIFLETGGCVRKTLRLIRAQHISFPDCKPPVGYKISYQLKLRGDGYYLNRSNVIRLLTNPVYIGHWCSKDVVLIWNNHDPIVPTDTYMNAFNYLSRYTLKGEENTSYHPSYQYARPELDEIRDVERPLCAGLIYSKVNGKWIRAALKYCKPAKAYNYALSANSDIGTSIEWERRASWIDRAIVKRFRQKLDATYSNGKWMQSIGDVDEAIERELKIKRAARVALQEAMANLIASIATLSNPRFIQEVEKQYEQMEVERNRLTAVIEGLEQRKQEQITFEKAEELFKLAAESWDEITQDERRGILGVFLDHVVASDYDRSGKMILTVYWRDGENEVIGLRRKPKSQNWSVDNIEILLDLVDAHANQLEIASRFPDMKWYQIFNEVEKYRGLVRYCPSYLGHNDTYEDYVARGGGRGMSSPSPWRPHEEEQLRQLVECRATQLEIMQVFPYRRWVRIQNRISKLLGKGTRVPHSGINQHLSYLEYEQQSLTPNLISVNKL